MDEPNDDKPEGGMPEGGKGKAKADYFSDCLAILKARGLALPPDTNVKNVWERLYVAGHALDGAEAATGEDMGGDDLPPMDDEPEVTFDDAAAEGGEADEMGGDPLDVGATPEGEDEDAPVEEEQRPVMMSLAKLKDPVARGSVRVLEKKHKASLLARIERLQKRGLSPAMAQELRDSLDGYSLGFTLSADGEVQIGNKQLDRRISDVERVMPLRNPLKGMRTAKAQSRPMRTEAETTRAQEDAGDELARLAGVNVPMATKKNRA